MFKTTVKGRLSFFPSLSISTIKLDIKLSFSFDHALDPVFFILAIIFSSLLVSKYLLSSTISFKIYSCSLSNSDLLIRSSIFFILLIYLFIFVSLSTISVNSLSNISLYFNASVFFVFTLKLKFTYMLNLYDKSLNVVNFFI